MKKSTLFYITILIIFLSSCKKKDFLEIGNTSISKVISVSSNSNIPYTDDATLAQIAKNPNFVPYKTAHRLALIQMISSSGSTGWNGTILSPKPVVVYDSRSNPKYYEFIVQSQDGTPLGTITACAQKEAAASISHILPYVRDYSFALSKGAGVQLVSGGYPNRILLGIPGKSGSTPSTVIDPFTGQVVDTVPSEDAQGMINALNKYTPAQLDSSYGISNVYSVIDSIQLKDQENKAEALAYWVEMDSLDARLSTMSDDSIAALLTGSKGLSISTYYTTDQYIITAYSNPNLQKTTWNGWCGPSAIAWIYRGLYTSYNGVYLPTAGEANFYKYDLIHNNPDRGYWPIPINGGGYGGPGTSFKGPGMYFFNRTGYDLNRDWVNEQSSAADNGLYGKIADNSLMYLGIFPNNGVTFPPLLGYALASVTNEKYTLFPIPYINFYIPLITPNLPGHTYIRNSHLPLVCLVEWLQHYVVAFGSKYEYWNMETILKIFGVKIIDATVKLKIYQWLLVQDNGNETGPGYLPFWRNDVLTFDIQYPVVKL